MARNNNQDPVSSQPAPPPPELLNKFLDNQTRELSLREQQLVLEQQKDKHAYEFSQKALVIQGEDREKQRAHIGRRQTITYCFSGFIALLVCVVIVFAMLKDKDQVALEIIKLAASFGIGGVGGYAWGQKKSISQQAAAQSARKDQ